MIVALNNCSDCSISRLVLRMSYMAALLSGVSSGALAADPPMEFCAFEVKVSSPANVPLVNTSVMMFRSSDPKGERVALAQVMTNSRGVARLCDAPMALVSIAAGADVCGLVVVQNLLARWPTTQHVLITSQNPPCAHFVFENKCTLLFRVQNAKGGVVQQARMNYVTAPGRDISQEVESDSLGRIYLTLAHGESIDARIVKAGVGAASIREECVPLKNSEIERKVMLLPR